MGKTIKQIAAELRVSKQAVWQRVKRSEELSALLESHAETVNGTIYVDAILEQCIKGLYPDRSAPAEDSSTGASTSAQSVDETCINVDETPINKGETVDETTVNVDVNALVETLQNTVDALKRQLMEKDSQIAGLTTALSETQQVQIQLSSALATSQQTQKQLSDALAAAQALHAGTLQRLADRSGGSERRGGAMVTETVAEREPQEHQGFWARIFGKRKKG